MSKRSKPRKAVPSKLLDGVFGALAHPVRRQILASLYGRGGVMTAGEIADRFKHSWPTTTRHLGVLESAGLLEVGKQGRNRLYALKPEIAMRAVGWVTEWANEAVDVTKRPDWASLEFASMRNAMPPG